MTGLVGTFQQAKRCLKNTKLMIVHQPLLRLDAVELEKEYSKWQARNDAWFAHKK